MKVKLTREIADESFCGHARWCVVANMIRPLLKDHLELKVWPNSGYMAMIRDGSAITDIWLGTELNNCAFDFDYSTFDEFLKKYEGKEFELPEELNQYMKEIA